MMLPVLLLISFSVFSFGCFISYKAPFYWPYFTNQQNAFYLFSFGLACLSLVPFSVIPDKIRALLKIIFSISAIGAVLWSFYWAWDIGVQLFGFWPKNLKHGLNSFKPFFDRFEDTWDFYKAVWGVLFCVSMAMVACVAPFYRKLLFDPFKDLFKAGEKRRLTKGPWQGSFMPKKKVNVLTSNKTGMPLGLVPRPLGFGHKIARFKENPEKGWIGGHHVVISGTRGGKGVSCVLPAILDHDGPVAAVDIKGELFSTTKRYRESIGRKVVVLNPYGVIKESSCHWNPLSYIRDDHFDRDVAAIAEGLIKKELGKNSHFSDWARDLLKISIEVLKDIMPRKKFNLVELHNLIFEDGIAALLNSWRENPILCGGKAAKIARTALEAGEEERGSFFTTLSSNLSWITLKPCQSFLQKSDFDINEILSNKMDLFCVIPMDMIEEMSGFFRLFSNLMLTTMIRQSGTFNAEKPLLLVLDEFTRLGRLEKLMTIITVGAGAGVEAFMIAQDRSSIEAVWGEETETILGNAATTRIFNIGRPDSKTAPWVASLMGDTTLITHTKSSSSNQKMNQEGESFSQTKDKLLTAVNIQEMDHNQILCFIRGQKPLLLKRIISHKDRFYKQKLDKNLTLLNR